jgi:uncharacterized protein YeaO (DUF488 family)
MAISLKRAYEKPAASDGVRILVDRLWPRGLTKSAAKIDLWLRDLAPSHQLRRWYHARPQHWQAFRKKYLGELEQPEAAAALEELYRAARGRAKMTLVYSSRNDEHNNAVVLRELLEGMRKPPSSSGPAAAARGKARAVRSR